jgi:hypothetical protein
VDELTGRALHIRRVNETVSDVKPSTGLQLL